MRVYDLTASEGPAFVRQLPPIRSAGRAVVGSDDRIFVTGKLYDGADWTLLVFTPDGDWAKYSESIGTGLMGDYFDPRGLYQHDVDQKRAYFMNSFPFDVRLVQIAPAN